MKIRTIGLALLMLFALVGGARAAPADPCGWNGVRWGTTITAVQKRFPQGKVLLDTMFVIEKVAAAPGVKPGYVSFTFERKDKTLRRVSIMPGALSNPKPGRFTPAELTAIKNDLVRKYGAATSVTGDLTIWSLPATTILLAPGNLDFSAR